ncbi:DUF1476 domain-containing protein [Sphingosinicella sp.]|jgi:hypothetical protein|uniref:DUF1476 domain-containing protein n=1 Tax=Sphingosinicella sp. TaxID=1917971 RepID=UPI0017B78500|nr:DUF1476 domain-containing protein [Sphingosinicella sp.]MBA4757919.1 DUF1476 domain-containing protein [Sphingosinicella sp.]MEA3539484.1 DUF1476 domain-containing protein [Pseudomonadota bacterium]
MTNLNDREKAFENRFARDAELQFKVTARRNRLLGNWAAEKLGLNTAEADAYSREVVAADFEEAGDDDVFRKVYGDLTAKGVEVTEHEVRRAMEEKLVEARRQFIEEV